MAELLTLTHSVIHEGNLISRLQFNSGLSMNHFFPAQILLCTECGCGRWAGPVGTASTGRGCAGLRAEPAIPSVGLSSIKQADNAAEKHGSPGSAPHVN